ncbi:hypothetical protein RhiirA4_485741, partial [Rhizophagus irregularis]
MIFKPFENFEINDFILSFFTIYVAYYYYKYFTRINPLPGPFPLPLIGTFHYLIWFRWIKKDTTMFFKFCYDKYGDIYEINNTMRIIVLCRSEYFEDLSTTKSKLEMRCPDYEGLKELGV